MYEKIKSLYPNKNVEVLVLIKNKEGLFFNLITNSIRFINKKDLLEKRYFDSYMFVSTLNKTIIPIYYNDKGKIKPIKQNITRLSGLLDKLEEVEVKNKTKVITDKTDNVEVKDEPVKSLISDVVKTLATKNLVAKVDDKEEIKIEINSRDLNRILKKHKIKDPDVTSNVKIALDNYLKINKDLSRDEAEVIVLKAIHNTVHGTDQVSEEYLADPNLLIKKLKDIDAYKVKLNFPKTKYVIDPKDIIDIDYTTGQFRQKFEFEEAIHGNVTKLFESISNTSSHPIKVKSIKHEIKDNDLDRFIEYTATLQNLTGANKKPYKVNLKIPSPVNDKYFKIHGNNYIISSQQFLKPITKTEVNDVRILTNYAIVRIQLENLKFNPNQIDEIINYIKIKYPNLIKKEYKDVIEFNNNATIFLNGENVYKDKENDIYLDSEDNKLKNRINSDTLNIGRYEYLFQVFINLIATVNPDDKLTKTKKSIPYLNVYISGIKIPFIYYMWSQKGLLSTLNDFGFDYEITDKPKGDVIMLPTSNDQFLVIKPKSFREKIIINGLLYHKIKNPIEDFNDKEEIYQFINQQYGSRTVYRLNLTTENEIDPVTKELLEFENLPTNLPALFAGPCIDILLNEKPSKLSDLKIYRSRMSEMTLHIMYNQIKQAHNHYSNKIEFGDENAKILFDQEYIFNNMIQEGILQHTQTVNPIAELMLASRVIKTGPGGVNDSKAFKPEHRNTHKSHEGIISAESTKENSNVGLITAHTLNPTIINNYGSYGKKDISNISGWNYVSADESIIPFQNELDSDRLVLAVTHANQVTPINNSERPLVGTGAEYIIPQLSSTRFVVKAKKDGKIIKIEKNKIIHVKYNDGTKEIFDIVPRKAQTKRGAYISLQMKTLEEGSKFKSNQPIAFTKNFDKDGIYCSGANIKVAMMNWLGYNHEDSYVCTKEFADATSTDVIKEIAAIIPQTTTILNIEKQLNKQLEGGEVLIEFTYEEDVDQYIEVNEIDSELENEDGEVTSIFSSGDNSIKLIAPPGEIIDIKLYINNKKDTDKSLINYHTKLKKDTKQTIGKIASSIKDKNKQLTATDNMDLSFMKIGKHKVKGNEFLGARIVYSIKQKKTLRIGDKLSNRLITSRFIQ